MINEPFFYALAVPAVLIVGISKGGFGGGMALISVPLLSLAVPPLQAAGIMLPLLCLMDLFGVHAYRRSWDRPNMSVILPAALAGIGLGSLSAGLLEERQIRLIVGLIALVFTADHWIGGRGKRAPTGLSRLKGGLWASVAGFTSFLAHAGGPPLAVYLLPQRLDKTIFVGTTVMFFAVVNYAKLVPYAWLGQLGPGNLLTALVLAPLAPLGIWLGLWIHKRTTARVFYEICYAVVFLAGCKLVYDGLELRLAAG